jgi:hypothetical protein
MILDPATLGDPAAVLAAARERRAEELRAAADVLALAARYAELHRVDVGEGAAVDHTTLIGDRGIPLAGDGAPAVSEFAVVELAAVLGLSTDSGRRLVGDALELRHRLPATWARVLDGTLPAFKARTVAQRTHELSAEAAGWVDAQVAPIADRLGWGQLARVVTEAMATFDPETAALKAEESKAIHQVTVETRPILTDTVGTATPLGFVDAVLDAADAADFDHAITTIAHDLLDQEATATLSFDERRAKAVGILAREHNSGQTAGQSAGAARVLHLYAHVDKGTLAGTGLVAVDNFQAVVPIERITEWATTPGTIVKPVQVIDLGAEIAREGYQPSQRQYDQVALIAQSCVFPHCHRPARRCDTDHITAYDAGGGTTTSNLAPLCRRHHRAKTFEDWDYEQTRPGEYLWRSPHGFAFLRHRGGGTTEPPADDLDSGTG